MRLVHRLRKGRHWLLLLLGGVVIALFPWTAYVGVSLPSEHVTHHWDLAWAGFDAFEAVALGATLLALLRRSPRLPVVAATAGTALLCDAWFDLITAEPGRELWWALVEALAAELPLAVLCFWLALDANRVLASGAGASAAGLPPIEPPEPPAEAPVASRTPGSEAPSAGRTSH
jgi:hypothetical protein